MIDMNKMLILIVTLFFAACGVAPDRETSESVKQVQGAAVTDQSSGIDVKVTKNGTTHAAFQSISDISGVGAQLVQDHLSVEIMSRDNKWVLMIEVPEAKEGTYRLADKKETGNAMIILTGDDRMLKPNTGELKLNEMSETYCSGSFTGTGTDWTGNKYSYEGRFSRVKVIRQE
jgi:hypothetical protein